MIPFKSSSTDISLSQFQNPIIALSVQYELKSLFSQHCKVMNNYLT